jgi:glycosyltransferase involved in cell wall biosynthesis
MQEADIFVFPSIRELGAGVVLEAMACGLACIVVDYGGPGTLIDIDRGVKVPLGDKDQITRSIGQALEALVSDEQTSVRLGLAAREHAMRLYTWDAKARKTLAVYEWVLGRGPRPNFWNS